MKVLAFLSLFILLSCCQAEELMEGASSGPASVTGTWKLERMILGWTNEEVSSESLEYEEFYTFRANSTFTKYRTNGEEASGTYTVGQNVEGYYIKIVYSEDNPLIESCTAGNEEFLRLEKTGILEGGSLPCDGPALLYEKVSEVD